MSNTPTSRNDQPCASCEVPREILERIRPAVLRYALEGEQALLKCKRGGLPAHYEDTLQRDALARDALLCAVDDILSITKRRVVSETAFYCETHEHEPQGIRCAVQCGMCHSRDPKRLASACTPSAVACSEPFKAEDDYAPSYVTGPNGFRFQCYNAVEMARQLNALFVVSAIRPTDAA